MTHQFKKWIRLGQNFLISCGGFPLTDYESDYIEIANYHLTQQQMLFQGPELIACLPRRDTSETLSCRDSSEWIRKHRLIFFSVIEVYFLGLLVTDPFTYYVSLSLCGSDIQITSYSPASSLQSEPWDYTYEIGLTLYWISLATCCLFIYLHVIASMV